MGSLRHWEGGQQAITEPELLDYVGISDKVNVALPVGSRAVIVVARLCS